MIKMSLKKAQSEIITTVLIILLVLAAVVIVWQVVSGTVGKGATQITAQTGCIGISLNIVKVNTTTLIVTRNPGLPDISNLTAKIFVNGADSGQAMMVNGELTTATKLLSPALTSGQRIQLAPVINGNNCPLGGEEVVLPA